jgi:hypothetical protein
MVIMYFRVLALAAAIAGVSAQGLQYGENQRGTIKDSDVVARAFPDVEGIELLSPAFLRPNATPPGWSNGTDGPTDDAEMGMFPRRDPHLCTDRDYQTIGIAPLSGETIGCIT